MKYFLLPVCFVLITFAGYTQKIKVNVQYIEKSSPFESDSIFYSPARKLMWSDFKEAATSGYGADAMTAANIGFTQDIQEKDGQIHIDVQVFAYVQKSNSWRKPTTSGSVALNHEQRHFDLAYLGALQLVDYLKKAKFKDKNYKDIVKSNYYRVLKENQAVQQSYDRGTDHGKNIQVQLEWNKNIDEMIEKKFNKVEQ